MIGLVTESKRVRFNLESMIRLSRYPTIGMLPNEQLTYFIVNENNQSKWNWT